MTLQTSSISTRGDDQTGLRDVEPSREAFGDEVRRGLAQTRKTLPCKYFYDEAGSLLFDRICELDEYYLTRTELGILRRLAPRMAAALGLRCTLIEYGSGSSLKTRVLLNAMRDLTAYVPIDISRPHLLAAARRLRGEYPSLQILPVCADYTAPFDLPDCNAARRCVFFPGSTIGNFEPDAAAHFLRGIRTQCGRGSALLIGVDLKKDPRLLHAAYNDAAGVTARFNLNILERINRELDGNFDLSRFAHYAFYNPRLGRMEMHLLSLASQVVRAAGASVRFAEGEGIFTESSYKYTPEEFARLASEAGYQLEQAWTDDRRWFSLQLLRAR